MELKIGKLTGLDNLVVENGDAVNGLCNEMVNWWLFRAGLGF
jgi:hypothetical protein